MVSRTSHVPATTISQHTHTAGTRTPSIEQDRGTRDDDDRPGHPAAEQCRRALVRGDRSWLDDDLRLRLLRCPRPVVEGAHGEPPGGIGAEVDFRHPHLDPAGHRDPLEQCRRLHRVLVRCHETDSSPGNGIVWSFIDWRLPSSDRPGRCPVVVRRQKLQHARYTTGLLAAARAPAGPACGGRRRPVAGATTYRRWSPCRFGVGGLCQHAYRDRDCRCKLDDAQHRRGPTDPTAGLVWPTIGFVEAQHPEDDRPGRTGRSAHRTSPPEPMCWSVPRRGGPR